MCPDKNAVKARLHLKEALELDREMNAVHADTHGFIILHAPLSAPWRVATSMLLSVSFGRYCVAPLWVTAFASGEVTFNSTRNSLANVSVS